jgi:hypothetical protein
MTELSWNPTPASVEQQLASPSLLSKERALRIAQMGMLLQELRRLLPIKASVYFDKRRNSVGQKGNTRSVTKLANCVRKIDSAAEHYRSVWEATRRLDPHGNWQKRFKRLEKQDVRPMEANASDVEHL